MYSVTERLVLRTPAATQCVVLLASWLGPRAWTGVLTRSPKEFSREGVLTAIHLARDAAVSGLLGGFAEVSNVVLVHGDEVEG